MEPLSQNKDLIKNSACDTRDVSNKSVLQHSRVISVVERHKMIILLRSLPSLTLRQLWNVSTVRVSPRRWTYPTKRIDAVSRFSFPNILRFKFAKNLNSLQQTKRYASNIWLSLCIPVPLLPLRYFRKGAPEKTSIFQVTLLLNLMDYGDVASILFLKMVFFIYWYLSYSFLMWYVCQGIISVNLVQINRLKKNRLVRHCTNNDHIVLTSLKI